MGRKKKTTCRDVTWEAASLSKDKRSVQAVGKGTNKSGDDGVAGHGVMADDERIAVNHHREKRVGKANAGKAREMETAHPKCVRGESRKNLGYNF